MAENNAALVGGGGKGAGTATAENKVAFITGGSQGIGKAMAIAFAKEGYRTIICSRTQNDVDRTASEISGMGFACEGITLDVSDPKAVSSAVASIAKRHGRLDVLVCCAGIYGPIGPLEENDTAKWAAAINVNLIGTMHTVRGCLPIMKKQKHGCIITMAGGGVGGPKMKPNFSSYVTSKYAICGFTEAMAKELEGTGVRINAISPGAVNTRLLSEVLSAGEKAGKEFLEASIKQQGSGGTPPEAAAGLAVYLASEDARHVSGKMLSAVWDDRKSITLMGTKIPGALYTLKRIDNSIYFEKKG